jgi:hypothetical protein
MEEQSKTVKKTRGNPAMTLSTAQDDSEKTKKKMEILAKLNEIEHRRGFAKFETTEQMQLMVENYFDDCQEMQIRPTIRGLASALGTVYSTLNDWERGSRDSQLGSQCSMIIKRAKQFISEYDELLALEGIDNPILFMFRAKNYYGMKDTQDIQVAPSNYQENRLTPEEIAKRIPRDIPVDIDYEETDTLTASEIAKRIPHDID